jgi:hypothetical protein
MLSRGPAELNKVGTAEYLQVGISPVHALAVFIVQG